MACGDKSTKFLKHLGYNVVKHPRNGIAPLELVGRQNGTVTRLGTIDQLIRSSESPMPRVITGERASNIEGQSSSSLTLGIGVNILGTLVAAMGGNLGIDASYTNAKKITFHYTDVLADRVQPLDVGDYLRDGDVDAGNLILREYVLGNGELFVITEIVATKKFSVRYEAKRGAELELDVPAIQQLAGGEVKVTASSEDGSLVSFEGPQSLTFGFKCLRVGVEDGVIRLLSSRAGDTALEALEAPRGEILGEDGRVELVEA